MQSTHSPSIGAMSQENFATERIDIVYSPRVIREGRQLKAMLR